MTQLIYLDNAATTFPKPRSVIEAMCETYQRVGVSPGRGSYDLSSEAQSLVEQTRGKIARFFGAPDPERVVFAANATDALNLAIQGIVQPGDHVVSTTLEHNSVLRPLAHLQAAGVIGYDLVPFDDRGFIDPDNIENAIRPNTRLVVVTQASNVMGTIQPIEAIGRRCSEKGVCLLVDTAQSAGLVPLDMTAWHVGAVAFTGHKALCGPTGIGGLVVHPDVDIQPTRFGGTGVDSKSLVHTGTYPHRLEAGTLNLMGIIGLSHGLDHIGAEGVGSILAREAGLAGQLCRGLRAIDSIRIFGEPEAADHVGLVTVTMKDKHPQDLADILDGDFGIAVRAGLHCAPLVHIAMGSYPDGGVRFSPGPFSTAGDIDAAIAAMAAIARF